MHHVGVVLSDPPIQCCLAQLCEKIKNAGLQVNELAPSDGDEFGRILMQVLDVTGSNNFWDTLKQSGKPLIKVVQLPKIEDALSAGDYKRLAVRLVAIRQKYLDLAHDGPNSYCFIVIIFPSRTLDLGRSFACRVCYMVTNALANFHAL